MRPRGAVLIAFLVLLLLSGLALAATQAPTLVRDVAGAGGDSLSAGSITVDNTLGQPLAGSHRAGTLELCAGFWCPAGEPPVEGQAPVAGLDATPRLGAAPLAVQFTDTSSYTPTAWLWTFGDDGTSTVQHPIHVYAVPGTYTVTLSVSNDYGSDEASRPDYIEVTARGVYLPLVVHGTR